MVNFRTCCTNRSSGVVEVHCQREVVYTTRTSYFMCRKWFILPVQVILCAGSGLYYPYKLFYVREVVYTTRRSYFMREGKWFNAAGKRCGLLA